MSRSPLARLGWRPRPPDARDYAMARALAMPGGVLPAVRQAERTFPPTRRLWRLERARTIDQGKPPWCVDATGKHWAWALPVGQDTGLPLGEAYRRCKAIDGYPNEDGTDARSLVKVFQSLGLVESYHFATSEADIRAWLLTRGPVMFGAFWREGNAAVGADGVARYVGTEIGGHETLLLGFRPSRTAEGGGWYTLQNSWGRSWAADGRCVLSAADVAAMLANSGDAVGVIQQRRTV